MKLVKLVGTENQVAIATEIRDMTFELIEKHVIEAQAIERTRDETKRKQFSDVLEYLENQNDTWWWLDHRFLLDSPRDWEFLCSEEGQELGQRIAFDIMYKLATLLFENGFTAYEVFHRNLDYETEYKKLRDAGLIKLNTLGWRILYTDIPAARAALEARRDEIQEASNPLA